MTLATETASETAQTTRETPKLAQTALPVSVQHERLLTLAADLLLENQQLSLKVARLEAELEKTHRALKAATHHSGLLIGI